MRTLSLELSAVDAWFFRDGRPYNERESNQTDVASLFPPSGSTLLGGLRAAWAREQGWDPAKSGTWDADCIRFLGDGFDELGCLALHGPYLLRRSNAQSASTLELLFPMPLHVLGMPQTQPDSNEPTWNPAGFLWPGPAVACDKGDVRLPIATPVSRNAGDAAGWKDGTHIWVNTTGLESILAGDLPDPRDVVSDTQLWKLEPRVGLVRDIVRRSTGEGALYSPGFVRLCRNVSLAVCVNLDLDGEPPDWLARVPKLFPLGGEGRLARCCPLPAVGPPPLPNRVVESVLRTGRVAVSLLTPLALCRASNTVFPHPQSGESLPGLPEAKIASACTGKPIRIGGWNSLARTPRPLVPFLPAGCTWFCEVRGPDRETVLRKHGQHIGEQIGYGFGQIVLGIWNEFGGVA